MVNVFLIEGNLMIDIYVIIVNVIDKDEGDNKCIIYFIIDGNLGDVF